VLKVGQGLEEEERHLMITIAWLIWLCRNKFVFAEEFQAPISIVRTARDNATRKHLDPNQRAATQVEAVWEKPPHGMVKINWDAIVDGERGRIGMGAIARDHSSNVIAMTSGPLGAVHDPSLAKALAAHRVAKLSFELGLQTGILEGDALEVVQAIN
jgi:hypothetical protein